MQLNVNPTRMELNKLKKRLALAKRGHKLLKDKLDGLVQRFLKLVKDYNNLKDDADQKMSALFCELVISSALTSPPLLEKITSFGFTPLNLLANHKNIMGVKLVEYELENFQEEISLAFADRAVPSQLIATVKEFYKFLPEFIKIANIGRTLEEMALSIIEIKRRVNALEYILIPELEAATKYIRMKLSESERSTLVRLMKVKDIVRAKN